MAKPRPEYEIYKRFTGRPDEPWDGPFPTLRAARARFDQALPSARTLPKVGTPTSRLAAP